MEPRPYQAEAFDAARKANVVMVGATGVGKTLVSLMLIRDYYFEDARRREAETHKWCIFLAPTQELVFQQARCAQMFTGVRCGPYVGRDLDYWGVGKWRAEIERHEVLVMTPNALLNLLHRGREYMSLENVGVLVFDECHQARKKHPYARVMAFYLALKEKGGSLPKVFGMTASPTVECVEVLQSRAYVCEDELIEEFQANAQWEMLYFSAFMPSSVVVAELEALMRMLFAETMCGFRENKERFVDIVVAPVLFTYQHLGLWCAVRHIVMFCEGFLGSKQAQTMLDRKRVIRTRKVVKKLVRTLKDSPLGFAVCRLEPPSSSTRQRHSHNVGVASSAPSSETATAATPPPTTTTAEATASTSDATAAAAAATTAGTPGNAAAEATADVRDDAVGKVGSSPLPPRGKVTTEDTMVVKEYTGTVAEAAAARSDVGDDGGHSGGGAVADDGAGNGISSGGVGGEISSSGAGGGDGDGATREGAGALGRSLLSDDGGDAIDRMGRKCLRLVEETEAGAVSGESADESVGIRGSEGCSGEAGGVNGVGVRGDGDTESMDEDQVGGDEDEGEDEGEGEGEVQDGQHGADVDGMEEDSREEGSSEGSSSEEESSDEEDEAARKMGEAEVAEWGITPGRVTSLVQALLRVAEEWGEEAKHFRCMVFVERRATARVLCDYLSHFLGERLKCGFVVGRAKTKGVNVHGGDASGSGAKLRQPQWRPLPDDIAVDDENRPERSDSEQDKDNEKSPQKSGGGADMMDVVAEGPSSVSGAGRGQDDGVPGSEKNPSVLQQQDGKGEGMGSGAADSGGKDGRKEEDQEEKDDSDDEELLDNDRDIYEGVGGLYGRFGVPSKSTSRKPTPTAADGEAADGTAQGAGEGEGDGGAGVGSDVETEAKGRVAHTINLFREGELQVLVTTDACSEGIDVPECNLVVSMDKIKTSRSMIHTRGRARSKGGKFVIMCGEEDHFERERVAMMLLESEDIKRFQLGEEKASLRVPLRLTYPRMVHVVEKSGAVVDMDMSMALLHEALAALGCDFHPLLVVDEKWGPERPMGVLGLYKRPNLSFKCRLELPSFLGMSTVDTEEVPEIFRNKAQARAAVAYLAVLRMLEKGLIDHRLNPRRTKDRLKVQVRRGYDPVLPEGRQSRAKATMPLPRPLAMGIVRTPVVSYDEARLGEWKRRPLAGAQPYPYSFKPLPPSLTNGEEHKAAPVPVDSNSDDDSDGDGGDDKEDSADATAKATTTGDKQDPQDEAETAAEAAAARGCGTAAWRHSWVRGAYENVPGPKTRMRVYCFRSPPGEMDGWVPPLREKRQSRGRDERTAAEGKAKITAGAEVGGGKGKTGVTGGGKDPGEGDGEGDGKGEKKAVAGAAAVGAEDEEDEEEHEADMRSFHPKLKVDLGRGPGKGLGPKMFVGLACAAPLPLTAGQAHKLGIEDSFDVEANPAQMAAIVQWHRETLGMTSLYHIPHQMTATPLNDPAKSVFQETGGDGDKGVLAVPVEYGDDGLAEGKPKIDWAAIEAANVGVHLPDDTHDRCTRRILFSRVSHKTCRFYFVLERTNTALGDYLRLCLESDLGPYAGLPCETITKHDAGKMGRVKGVLAVGHGVRKPDYEAALQDQKLLLGVPAPALRHSFAQHLIRGEKIMDPDAGVRNRVKKRLVSPVEELAADGENAGERNKEAPTAASAGAAGAASAGAGAAPDAAITEEGKAGDFQAVFPEKERGGGDKEETESEDDMDEGDDEDRQGAIDIEPDDDMDLDDDEAVAAAAGVVAAGAGTGGVSVEEVRAAAMAGDEDVAQWTGVSTLKTNQHKVGPGQPVLLVEQYCQPICYTRRVFISVLHLVPRMFDLERQLLCFVLHESLFMPALQTSLFHHHRHYNSYLRSGSDDVQNDPGHGNMGHDNAVQVHSRTTLEVLPEEEDSGERHKEPGENGGRRSMSVERTRASSGDGGGEAGVEERKDGGGSCHDVAVDEQETPDSSKVDVNAAPNAAAKAKAPVDEWLPNGTWSKPGQGAGTAAGPGGSLCSGDTSAVAIPHQPSVVPASVGKVKPDAAAEGGGVGAAQAAALGIIQFAGGEGSVADTMALLDCSLRRPVNERLETLGDAWLNYYAGFVVFQDKPVLLEEGMMTLLRKNVVSNARLIKCADRRGLREFMYPPRSILGRPFEMWAPSLLPLPPPVTASRKTIADVVEALLGAALVAGGNRSAAYLMEWLGLPTLESSNDPARPQQENAFKIRPRAFRPKAARDGEEKGGEPEAVDGKEEDKSDGACAAGACVASGDVGTVVAAAGTTDTSPPQGIVELAAAGAAAAFELQEGLAGSGSGLGCDGGDVGNKSPLSRYSLPHDPVDQDEGKGRGGSSSNRISGLISTSGDETIISNSTATVGVTAAAATVGPASNDLESKFSGSGSSSSSSTGKRKQGDVEAAAGEAPACGERLEAGVKRMRTPDGHSPGSASTGDVGNGGEDARSTAPSSVVSNSNDSSGVCDMGRDVAPRENTCNGGGGGGGGGDGGEGTVGVGNGITDGNDDGIKESAVAAAVTADVSGASPETAAASGDVDGEEEKAGKPTAVEDSERPWLWKPPGYLLADPGRFGAFDAPAPSARRPSPVRRSRSLSPVRRDGARTNARRMLRGRSARVPSPPPPPSPRSTVSDKRVLVRTPSPPPLDRSQSPPPPPSPGNAVGGTDSCVPPEIGRSMATESGDAGMVSNASWGRHGKRGRSTEAAGDVSGDEVRGSAISRRGLSLEDVQTWSESGGVGGHRLGGSWGSSGKVGSTSASTSTSPSVAVSNVMPTLSPASARALRAAAAEARIRTANHEKHGENEQEELQQQPPPPLPSPSLSPPPQESECASQKNIVGEGNGPLDGPKDGSSNEAAKRASEDDHCEGRVAARAEGPKVIEGGQIEAPKKDGEVGKEAAAGESKTAGDDEKGKGEIDKEGKEEEEEEEEEGEWLEGLREDAQWPIRREPLMSAEYLADTGVLPKVYVTTRPSERLMGNIRGLEKMLGYKFRHPWLCLQAITHPSWTMFDKQWKQEVEESEGCGRVPQRVAPALPPGTVPAQDYQRLEFLGDAVLGWMVTAHLYFASSEFTPAELTRIKSSLVCNASLWVIALGLNLHHVLRASPKILGNIHSFIENNINAESGANGPVNQNATPPKHPADVLEALIAAVFLDCSCDMSTVSRVFWPHLARYLQKHPPPAEDDVEGGVVLCLRERKKKKMVSDEAQATTAKTSEEKHHNQDVIKAAQASKRPPGNINDQPPASSGQSSSSNGKASGVDRPTSACVGDATSTRTTANSKLACNRGDKRPEDGNSSRSPASGGEVDGHGHRSASDDQPSSTSDKCSSNNDRGYHAGHPSSACDGDAVAIRASASDDRAYGEKVCNGHEKRLGDGQSSGNLASSSEPSGHGRCSIIVDQALANSGLCPSSNGRAPSADRPTPDCDSDGTTISEDRAQSDLSCNGHDDYLGNDGSLRNPEMSELHGHGECGGGAAGVGDGAVATAGCPEGQGGTVESGRHVVQDNNGLRVGCGENNAGSGIAGIGTDSSLTGGGGGGIIEDWTTDQVSPAVIDGGVTASAVMGVGTENTKVVDGVGVGREGTLATDVDELLDEESEGIQTTSKRAKMTDFATKEDHYA